MKKLPSTRCLPFKRSNIRPNANVLINFSDIKTHNWIVFIMKLTGFFPLLSLPATDKYTFGSVHDLNSEDGEDDVLRSDCSWFSLRSSIPIIFVTIYTLRFILTILLQLFKWRYLTVSSCPSLIITLKCISATCCVIFFFAKKCQIEEIIIISSSFLRPMPISAKFDIRLYSVLVLILLGFSIIIESISNSLVVTQWDLDSYQTRFTIFADQLFGNIESNALIDSIFYFDLILQHFIAFILIIGKVFYNLIFNIFYFFLLYLSIS